GGIARWDQWLSWCTRRKLKQALLPGVEYTSEPLLLSDNQISVYVCYQHHLRSEDRGGLRLPGLENDSGASTDRKGSFYESDPVAGRFSPPGSSRSRVDKPGNLLAPEIHPRRIDTAGIATRLILCDLDRQFQELRHGPVSLLNGRLVVHSA